MTWRGKHIYLTGLPGAGKTSIGKELAALLSRNNYRFIDLDEEVIKRSGKTIAEMFSEINGAERFRELETNVLLEVAQGAFEQKPYIVATGGGTPIREINRKLMRGSGVTVWVDVTVKQAAKNVLTSLLLGETRPLLHSSSLEQLHDKLRVLQSERTTFYEQAVLHFVARTSSGGVPDTKELATEVLKALEQMSRRVLLRPKFEVFPVKAGMGDYSIAIGNGIAAQELGFAIRDMQPRRVIFITDENVASLYGSKFIEKAVKESGTAPTVNQIILPAGESAKDKENLFHLLDTFSECGLRRKMDLIVTLGGGVVSDIGGLAASLFNRGIPVIHLPTTLIGQVDASIGGKTGIDYQGAKNAIGSFYPPKLVLIDPLFLKTLPKRELQAGLAEVLKYGLIGSRDLWSQLSKGIRRLLRGIDTGYEIVIRSAVKEKLKYIGSDEYERSTGIRELLNFGHTFAHAFESATDFKILHGEAVALGMRAASWLSMELGLLPEDEWREIEHVLGRLPIPNHLQLSADDVFSFISKDKKQRDRNTRLILLDGIGKAVVKDAVSEKDVKRAVEFVESVML